MLAIATISQNLPESCSLCLPIGALCARGTGVLKRRFPRSIPGLRIPDCGPNNAVVEMPVLSLSIIFGIIIDTGPNVLVVIAKDDTA